MSVTRLKSYPTGFKESSAKLALSSGNSIAQTARELGIKVNTLYTWVARYSSPSMEQPMKKDENNIDEINRLKKELALVTEERDLLKEAAAYFAKEAR